MLSYALPIGNGKRALWYPSPRFVWGVLKGLGDKTTILSPDPNLDVTKVPLYTHDNIYRPTIRRMFGRRRIFTLGRMMLWGIIWMANMDNPVEDLVGGIYLLVGVPLFIRLTSDAFKHHLASALTRFQALFYSPRVEVVHSPRLQALELIIETMGIHEALSFLDTLGFGHLREFYRRVAWQTRWTTPPPTGAGLL